MLIKHPNLQHIQNKFKEIFNKDISEEDIVRLIENIKKKFDTVSINLTDYDIGNYLIKAKKKDDINAFVSINYENEEFTLIVNSESWPPLGEIMLIELQLVQDIQTKFKELFYKNVSEKEIERLVKNIKQEFDTVNVKLTYNNIGNYLIEAEKKGVTNAFVKVIYEDNEFILRINGELWPPYNRESEDAALKKAKECDVETTVIANPYKQGFQICQINPSTIALNEILEPISVGKNTGEIVGLVAKEFAKYHIQTLKIKEYPIKDTFFKANNMMLKKFDVVPEYAGNWEDFCKFSDICKKIITVLDYSNMEKTFSHCEPFSTSVYFNSENSKIYLVDWEYASLAYWSYDLSVLSRFLDESQKEILAKQYHVARTGKNNENEMEEKYKFQLKLNTFLCEFIDLCWRLGPKTIKKYEEKMRRMESEVELFSARLNILYKHATDKTTFFRSPTGSPYPSRISFSDVSILTDELDIKNMSRL